MENYHRARIVKIIYLVHTKIMDINGLIGGVINDSDIESVLSNDNKMNIIDNLRYSFRICWIIGNGEENTPPEHEEIK